MKEWEMEHAKNMIREFHIECPKHFGEDFMAEHCYLAAFGDCSKCRKARAAIKRHKKVRELARSKKPSASRKLQKIIGKGIKEREREWSRWKN